MPSTVIKTYLYSPETEKLRIVYRSGAVYDYFKVSLELYEEFRTAFSKGVFLNKRIKPNHPYEKVSV